MKSSLPNRINKTLPRRLYKFCSARGGLAILREQRILLSRPHTFNDLFDVRPHFASSALEMLPWHRASVERELRAALKTENTVMFCVSSILRSQLLWGHYGESHLGIVIAFDPRIPLILGESPHRVDFRRITYSAKRPSKQSVEDLSNDDVYYTKSRDWAYEKEWRLVDSLFSADDEPADDSHDRWFFNLNPQSVKEVILGGASGLTLKLEVGAALVQRCFLHVLLQRMWADPKRYELHLESFNREEWAGQAKRWGSWGHKIVEPGELDGWY